MLRKKFKQSALFLLPLLLGAGAGIWLFSSGIAYMLTNHQVITNFFFIGLIVGSIPMVFQKATESEFKKRNLIPFVITLAVMIATLLISPVDSTEIIRTDVYKRQLSPSAPLISEPLMWDRKSHWILI